MTDKTVKTITLPNSRKLELVLNKDVMVIKVDIWDREKHVSTHHHAYSPLTEDAAVEKYKYGSDNISIW
jgi:hypothetical protein